MGPEEQAAQQELDRLIAEQNAKLAVYNQRPSFDLGKGAAGAELDALNDQILAAKNDLESAKAIPGANPWTDFYSQQAFGGGNLNLPGMQLANQDQARNEQAKVIQALQSQARGDMSTLGQQQLAQGFQQAGAQQRSLGSSIRGAGGGAGLRAGAMGAADTQRGLSGQQDMLKLQEQQAAQAMLAQLLAQQQAQDVGLAGSMAGGGLTNQQLNQEMERFYGSGLLGGATSAYQRRSDYESARLGQNLQAKDLDQRFRNQMAGMGAGGVGALQKIGSNWGSNQSQDGYRTVDGQNSIVPIEDK